MKWRLVLGVAGLAKTRILLLRKPTVIINQAAGRPRLVVGSPSGSNSWVQAGHNRSLQRLIMTLQLAMVKNNFFVSMLFGAMAGSLLLICTGKCKHLEKMLGWLSAPPYFADNTCCWQPVKWHGSKVCSLGRSHPKLSKIVGPLGHSPTPSLASKYSHQLVLLWLSVRQHYGYPTPKSMMYYQNNYLRFSCTSVNIQSNHFLFWCATLDETSPYTVWNISG